MMMNIYGQRKVLRGPSLWLLGQDWEDVSTKSPKSEEAAGRGGDQHRHRERVISKYEDIRFQEFTEWSSR